MVTIPIHTAPIACTLSSEDFQKRALWLRAMTERALVRHRIDDTTATLTYRADAAADIEEPVQRERSCCAFVEFGLNQGDDDVVLTITAPASTDGDACLLLAHLLPTRQSSTDVHD